VSRAVDLRGLKFAYWRVLERGENNRSNRITWLCRCACGTERLVGSQDLRQGRSLSCGCRQKVTPPASVPAVPKRELAHERRERERAERRVELEEQVARGTLVIRVASPAEFEDAPCDE
jgi:hypothetical protein